jgi:hypothetical protein
LRNYGSAQKSQDDKKKRIRRVERTSIALDIKVRDYKRTSKEKVRIKHSREQLLSQSFNLLAKGDKLIRILGEQ